MSDTVVEVIVSGVCGAVDVVDAAYTLHNNLPDLQGGQSGQYYHLTSDQLSSITGLPPVTVDPRYDSFFEKDIFVSGTIYQGSGYSKALTGLRTLSDGKFYDNGDAQVQEFILKRETIDNGTYELAFSDTNKKLILPDASAWAFKIKIIARDPASGNAAVWNGTGGIKRGVNAVFTEIIGATHLIKIHDQINAGGVVISANTSEGRLKIEVTGKSATTIRWVAYLTLMQIL